MLNSVRDCLNKVEHTATDTVLVAVSGGVDSMVLLHILHGMGIRVAVAHCNFGLRGTESDADEQMVEELCKHQNIPFHVSRFETKTLAAKSSSSVQMVARDLRYNFFKELMEVHDYRFTALAHHADDRIESLILNVLRGTGVRGLQGMPAVRGPYIRPLLTFRKHALVQFANENEVNYRRDASNAEPKYRRNRVRLHLLPMLRILRPDAEDQLLHFAEKVEQSIPDFERWAGIQRKHLVLPQNNALRIEREKLRNHPYPFTILKEIIGPMGYSSEQVFELLREKAAQSGVMDSQLHRIFIEKNALVIFKNYVLETAPRFSAQRLFKSHLPSLNTTRDTILVDANLVNLDRLSIRKWTEGDRFRPLGMKGTKKLSDYFIDNKFTASQKATTWLLMHGKEIVWVMGHRMDDRFKVTKNTNEVLKIVANDC